MLARNAEEFQRKMKEQEKIGEHHARKDSRYRLDESLNSFHIDINDNDNNDERRQLSHEIMDWSKSRPKGSDEENDRWMRQMSAKFTTIDRCGQKISGVIENSIENNK
jgi:hypothetical protein